MRLIDADDIYFWYVKAFSAEVLGKEREIKPDDVRFSMKDIRENLNNIPTVKAIPLEKLEQIRKELIELSVIDDSEEYVDNGGLIIELKTVLEIIDKAIKEVSNEHGID